ncbi:MAG: alginate export family protein [Methylococcales bacterium]|nr:alginate export family protein [Methylococcales bacterium]
MGGTNENFGLIFEGQDSRTNFDQQNELSGNVMTDAFDVLQLFTSASLKNIAGTGVRADADLGRFSMDIGSSRFIGRNGFEQTTNSFEGGHLSFTAENQWRFRTFMVSLVNRTMYQANESHQSPLMWGADFEIKPTSWLNTEAYYIGANDNNGADLTKHKAFSVFGTRAYLKPIATAKLKKEFGVIDYDFETAVETGEKGKKDFFAYMGHAEVGYTFNSTWFPHLMGEYEYASGTANPNGGMNNTLDRLSGVRTNMFITSLFGPMFQSNLEYGGLRLITQPLDSVKMNVKHHVWYLAEAKDAMAGSAMPGNANLQDKTGSAGRYLGQDVEFSTSWDLRSNLTLAAGYEHWFKGDYFSRLPVSANLPVGGAKDTDYFYMSSEVRF